MAFLVEKRTPAEREVSKEIYLDQDFYSEIFTATVEGDSAMTQLRTVASLRYKSPTLEITGEDLESLIENLELLLEIASEKRQISKFRDVCIAASKEEATILVSGDMHPELELPRGEGGMGDAAKDL